MALFFGEPGRPFALLGQGTSPDLGPPVHLVHHPVQHFLDSHLGGVNPDRILGALKGGMPSFSVQPVPFLHLV